MRRCSLSKCSSGSNAAALSPPLTLAPHGPTTAALHCLLYQNHCPGFRSGPCARHPARSSVDTGQGLATPCATVRARKRQPVAHMHAEKATHQAPVVAHDRVAQIPERRVSRARRPAGAADICRLASIDIHAQACPTRGSTVKSPQLLRHGDGLFQERHGADVTRQHVHVVRSRAGHQGC